MDLCYPISVYVFTTMKLSRVLSVGQVHYSCACIGIASHMQCSAFLVSES